MNVKEISKLTGRTQQTIRQWVKSAQQQNLVTKHQILVRGKDTDFNLPDTIAIIRAGKNETLANLLEENAIDKPTAKEINYGDMFKAMTEVMSVIKTSLSVIENNTGNKQNLLIAPPMTDRMRINQIVRKYAIKKGIYVGGAWKMLYDDLLYRLRVNVTLQAKNQNIAAIDFLENNGYLPDALAVALEMFGE